MNGCVGRRVNRGMVMILDGKEGEKVGREKETRGKEESLRKR